MVRYSNQIKDFEDPTLDDPTLFEKAFWGNAMQQAPSTGERGK